MSSTKRGARGGNRWLLPLGVLAVAVAGGVLAGWTTSGDPGAKAPAAPASGRAAVRPAAAQAIDRPAAAAAQTIERVRIATGAAPSVGPEDAPVTLIEFIDYQCPFCLRAHETIKKVAARYGDKIRMVYLQNPLDFHKEAPLAAQAALAAAEQGRFADMHDMLLENRARLGAEQLPGYAKRLDLDLPAFEEALATGRFAAQVQENQRLAAQVGARGTPFFLINGRAVSGAQPYQIFEKIIEEELSGNLAPTRWVARVTEPPRRQPPRRQAPREDPNKIYKVNLAGSISRGPENAPVTVVEFTDFQCPFCARGQETLMQVMDAYPEQVRVVVKNLPLSFHAQAEPAAIAALAAHRQGKYWEYRPLLFANQRQLTAANLRAFAGKIGLDMARFDRDMQDPELAAIVKRDVNQAASIGISGTPTFLINGRKLVGAQPFALFKQAIDTHLVGSGASK